jgi:ribosomal protein S18 acetylase RimI-like enzyme
MPPHAEPTARLTAATVEDIRAQRSGLIALLQATVVNGAPLGFLHPVSDADADAYWDRVVASVDRRERIVVLAFEGGRLAGAVQLELAANQNARHRAAVQKLAVHPELRGRGIGRALMRSVEDEAREAGRTLLVLDTREGGYAERFYEDLGWVRSGRIPDFMRDEAGRPHAAIVFHKNLAG